MTTSVKLMSWDNDYFPQITIVRIRIGKNREESGKEIRIRARRVK